MSARPAAVAMHRRVKSFRLAMRRLEDRGMLCWSKGAVAQAAHAEVNASRIVGDEWVRRHWRRKLSVKGNHCFAGYHSICAGSRRFCPCGCHRKPRHNLGRYPAGVV